MAKGRRGKGEGSIYWNPKRNRWEAALTIGRTLEGRQRRRVVTGKTKRAVQARLTQLKLDAHQGLSIEPNRITVAQHFGDWLQAKKANTAKATFSSYESTYRVHIAPVLGRVKLTELTYRQVNDFYALLDTKVEEGMISPRTRAYIVWLLRSALDDAVHKDVVPKNQAKKAGTRTHKPKEAEFMDWDEIQAFLRAAKGERLENLFILMLQTGLRPREAMGLAWEHIDLKNAKLHVRQALHEDGGELYLGGLKTDAALRTLSLSETAVQVLKRQRMRQMEERLRVGPQWSNPDDLVFTNISGGYLRRTNIQRRDLRRIIQRARIAYAEELVRTKQAASASEAEERSARFLAGVTLHTFRHTHASLLTLCRRRPEGRTASPRA